MTSPATTAPMAKASSVLARRLIVVNKTVLLLCEPASGPGIPPFSLRRHISTQRTPGLSINSPLEVVPCHAPYRSPFSSSIPRLVWRRDTDRRPRPRRLPFRVSAHGKGLSTSAVHGRSQSAANYPWRFGRHPDYCAFRSNTNTRELQPLLERCRSRPFSLVRHRPENRGFTISANPGQQNR